MPSSLPNMLQEWKLGIEAVTVSQIELESMEPEVHIVQEGLPEVIPLEMCYLGWQESLAQLANLVEPDVAG